MLKIIFAGTPLFALPCLKALHASEHQILGVYTQPDRPAGRGRKLTVSPVKQFAQENALAIYQPTTLGDPEQQKIFAALKPDIMIVIAYGLLLPPAILDTPKYGCINVHASLLPRWRGAAPIQYAILSGDNETGITIMQMEKGLDTGPILVQQPCPIEENDSAAVLQDRLSAISVDVLLESLKSIESNTIKPQLQDDQFATHAPKIKKQQGQLNWSLSAVELERQIRAFNPWPIASSNLNTIHLRILEAEVIDETITTEPGTIIKSTKTGLDVATGNGILRIRRLQLPGKKPLAFSDVLNAKADLFAPGKCFF